MKLLIVEDDIAYNQLLTRRMIKHGFAWWYRYYRDQLSLEDQALYESAETYSKSLKLGLWQSEKPRNPYEWRKLKKHSSY